MLSLILQRLKSLTTTRKILKGCCRTSTAAENERIIELLGMMTDLFLEAEQGVENYLYVIKAESRFLGSCLFSRCLKSQIATSNIILLFLVF